MNLRKQSPPAPLSPRRWVLGAGVLTLMFIAWSIYLLWPTPQLGGDEEVLRTVDALFTAVTGRNDKALQDCERRLRLYREAGKLPTSAAETLDTVIAQARGGRWEAAATRLYDFILAQRGDGHAVTKRKTGNRS